MSGEENEETKQPDALLKEISTETEEQLEQAKKMRIEAEKEINDGARPKRNRFRL